MDAQEFINFRNNARAGPFFCGDSELKGRTVQVDEIAQRDNVKRFSDKWITQRRLGNTIKTYSHFSPMLGTQLCSFVGMNVQPVQAAPGTAAATLSRLEAVISEDTTEQPIEVEKDEQEEEEAELPDEFEEFEDDDYNAEKYFDDGDGDGDIDDGGEPDYS